MTDTEQLYNHLFISAPSCLVALSSENMGPNLCLQLQMVLKVEEFVYMFDNIVYSILLNKTLKLTVHSPKTQKLISGAEPRQMMWSLLHRSTDGLVAVGVLLCFGHSAVSLCLIYWRGIPPFRIIKFASRVFIICTMYNNVYS